MLAVLGVEEQVRVTDENVVGSKGKAVGRGDEAFLLIR